MYILQIKSLSKNFGALQVLNDIDLNVAPGTLHSIVGPNGAGKTTLFNVISGFLKPSEGKVIYKGKKISNLQPHQAAKLGLRRSFQVITIFPELSVFENVRVAIQATRKHNFNFFQNALNFKGLVKEASEILQILGLADKANMKASELSHGQQRYLDIGMAMAGKGELLLLDEPTSGLVHEEISRMGETIKKLTPDRTVILIEHRIEMVLSISDVVTVLDYGCVIAQDCPDKLRGNETVCKAYLGLR